MRRKTAGNKKDSSHDDRPMQPRKGYYVKLLPKQHLYVATDRLESGQRFAKLFETAWNRFPKKMRSGFLCYWGKLSKSNPQIALLPNEPTMEEISASTPLDSKSMTSIYATCAMAGMLLSYWRPYIDVLPDDFALHEIVHELLHVCQFWRPPEEDRRASQSTRYAEAEVEEWSRSLGFTNSRINTRTISRWIRKHKPLIGRGHLAYSIAMDDCRMNVIEGYHAEGAFTDAQYKSYLSCVSKRSVREWNRHLQMKRKCIAIADAAAKSEGSTLKARILQLEKLLKKLDDEHKIWHKWHGRAFMKYAFHGGSYAKNGNVYFGWHAESGKLKPSLMIGYGGWEPLRKCPIKRIPLLKAPRLVKQRALQAFGDLFKRLLRSGY